MVNRRDAPDGIDKLEPMVALLGEHATAGGCNAVKSPSPLSFFFDPASLDPTPLFRPVQQRIKRRQVVSAWNNPKQIPRRF
jgi:hypothetical protein